MTQDADPHRGRKLIYRVLGLTKSYGESPALPLPLGRNPVIDVGSLANQRKTVCDGGQLITTGDVCLAESLLKQPAHSRNQR